MGESLDTTVESARKALLGLYGWADDGSGELLEISVKTPEGKWRHQHLEPSALWDQELMDGVRAWSARGRECYMGAVSLTERPEKSWRRGGAALRGRAGALWLDVDCQAPGRESEEFFTGVDEAVDKVDSAIGPVLAGASLVVGSGWGVQYWVPLREPVPGGDASRAVRALVGVVGAVTGKKIDRVWDVTRVMRMPGTFNWRAGGDEGDERPTGVIRWPADEYRGDLRLTYWQAVDTLAARMGLGGPDCLDNLLERYSAVSGESEEGTEVHAPLGEWLGDLDRLADEVLEWADVLEPAGWRCVSDPDSRGSEQVWERPGKIVGGSSGPERSAVVYADRPDLLVVYSDSPATGLAAGLRGGGHRGSSAGVGVIDKWRAWVDLAWGGVASEAQASVRRGGDDPVGKALWAAWSDETTWVHEWASDLTMTALDRWSGEMPPPW